MQFNSKIEITEILKLRVALYENTMVYWIKKQVHTRRKNGTI